MNRWHIYEMLKRNTVPSTEDMEEIEEMNAEEIKQGLLEWLTVLKNDKHYQNRRIRTVNKSFYNVDDGNYFLNKPGQEQFKPENDEVYNGVNVNELY